jgi:hypothetical protein
MMSKKSKFKSQKGSITLYVLFSMITFTIIAMSVYINSSYKVQAQQKYIEKIQNTYEKEDINELYQKNI